MNIHCGTECAEIVMHTYALQLYPFSVERKAIIGVEFRCSETKCIHRGIKNFPVLDKLGYHSVGNRIFNIPQTGIYRIERRA